MENHLALSTLHQPSAKGENCSFPYSLHHGAGDNPPVMVLSGELTLHLLPETQVDTNFLHHNLFRINSLSLSWWLKTVKNLPPKQEAWVWSLGQEDPLEKRMAAHSSICAWRIPWTEEPGELQFLGSHKVGHTKWLVPQQCESALCFPPSGQQELGWYPTTPTWRQCAGVSYNSFTQEGSIAEGRPNVHLHPHREASESACSTFVVKHWQG